nr:RNA-dependent RNA polymerase [Rhizoctonia zeae yadonushivirus 2]
MMQTTFQLSLRKNFPSSFPFSTPSVQALDLVRSYASRILHTIADLETVTLPIAIILPSVSGKSTIAKRLPGITVDIDRLPTTQERDHLTHLVDKALLDGQWEESNAYWRHIIKNKHPRHTILLAHSPHQLPPDYLFIVVNTPLHPYSSGTGISPARRKTMQLNRDHLRHEYSRSPHYVFLDRPHKVFKFITALIATPALTGTYTKPKLWFYRMRYIQSLRLLSRADPITLRVEDLKRYFTITYEQYTSIASTSEGIKSLPIHAWFTPTNIYKMSRYKPMFFDPSLGPLSDAYMLLRMTAPEATHFYKFMVRHYCYTIGDLYVMLKSFSSIFKKANHTLTPKWMDFVDHNMLLPPLPDPADNSEFIEQLDTWFTKPWPHGNASLGNYRHQYTNAAASVLRDISVTPDYGVSSLSAAFLNSAVAYGTSGSTPLKAKTHNVISGALEYRRTKNAFVSQATLTELLSYLEYNGPSSATATIKHEKGGRNRLIVAFPTPLYLQQAAVMVPLEPHLSSRRTTIFSDAQSILRDQMLIARSTSRYLSNPLDLKSCEAQQNQFELMTTLAMLQSLAHQAFPNATDIDDLFRNIKSVSAKGVIDFKGIRIENNKGNPSGVRFTNAYNTFFNNTQQEMANTFIVSLGLPASVNSKGTGDDSQSQNKSLAAIVLYKDYYNAQNFYVNMKVDFIGLRFSEFLRYVLTPTGIYGYVTRIIGSVISGNPYSNDAEAHFSAKLETRVNNWVTYYARAKQAFPYHEMYHDIQQMYQSRGFNLTIDQVFTLLHTPRSLYGLGVIPFCLSTPSYKYLADALPRVEFGFKRSRALSDFRTPDAYAPTFNQIYARTGLIYRPDPGWYRTYLFKEKTVEIRSSLQFTSAFLLAPSSYLTPSSADVILKEAMQTLVIPSLPRHLLLTSPFASLPFFTDLFTQFQNDARVSLLFDDPSVYALYNRHFRPSDLHSLVTSGIDFYTPSFPGVKAEMVSTLSRSLLNIILPKVFLSPPRRRSQFPQIALEIEHHINRFILSYTQDDYFYLSQ